MKINVHPKKRHKEKRRVNNPAKIYLKESIKKVHVDGSVFDFSVSTHLITLGGLFSCAIILYEMNTYYLIEKYIIRF